MSAASHPSVPGCLHERGHIVDSNVHGDNYATPASRRVFCDVCRLQRWAEVEAALALAEAEVGLIPKEAAEEIAAAARVERFDLDEIREGTRRTRHSLVALLSALQHACPGDTGEYVHYGATTQDIQDTAQSLEMADVLDEVDRELQTILVRSIELARAHRDTLMIGRTHARAALPTTFGLKVASWIDELLRHGERLDAMRPRVLAAQLFGGVGTMAGFAGSGPDLLARFAERLSLGAPAVGWHVARDRVAEYASALAMVAATLSRMADEVRTLSRPEFGELEEAWDFGSVGSSTMPHKRNPEECEQVVVLAQLAAANAGLGLQSMMRQEHERDARGLRLEWVAVADVSHHTLAALTLMAEVLTGLKVHGEHMAAQARQAADQVCTEALMLALGRRIGKQSAHALVYEVSHTAHDEGRSLRAALRERAEVVDCLPPDELEGVLDPSCYLGSAGRMVDEVVAHAERWVEGRPTCRR